MDVVGTASAALGIIQIGFSLAKAIRESIKNYKDAADDLISLAQDIESTLYLVSELEHLVQNNDQTGMFNAGGLVELTKCRKTTKQIVEALVELLTKTGIAHSAGEKINPEDLIISRSNRRAWLGRKPRVKDKQEELNKVRLEVTTIILLRDALQAKSSSEQAARQALVVAFERDRRRRFRSRLKTQKASVQSRMPDLTNNKAPADDRTGRDAVPLASRLGGVGDQALGSFAYQGAILEPGPVAGGVVNDSTGRGNEANHDLGNDSTADELRANDNPMIDNAVNDNAASGDKADIDVAHPRPIAVADNTKSDPASRFSPENNSPLDHKPLQFSREEVVEDFKRQTKADANKLLGTYQLMMERAAKSLGPGQSEDGLRKFLESEYALEWSEMFGDWLPGTQPGFPMSSDVERSGRKPSRLHRLKEDTQNAIWKKLQSDCALPLGRQWTLHSAEMAGQRPSLLARAMTRLVADVSYSGTRAGGRIVVFVAIHSNQAGKDAAKQVEPEDLRSGKAPFKETGHARTAQFVRLGEPVPKARNDPALRDIVATDAPYQTSYFGPGYRPVLGPTGSRTRRRPPIPEVPAPQSPVVTWSSVMSHAAESPAPTYVSSDSGHSRRTELYYPEGPADDLGASGSPAVKSHIDERRRFNFDRTQQHIARQRDLHSDNERATADPENRRQRYAHDPYTLRHRPKDERHHLRPAFRRRVSDYEDTARISGPGWQDRGVDYIRLRMDAPADHERSMLSRSNDYPAALQRRSSRGHDHPASLQSEDAESRVLSEDSLDDAELYDQLLQKFTGHGLHDRTSIDDNADEQHGEEGTTEEVDGEINGDGTGNAKRWW